MKAEQPIEELFEKFLRNDYTNADFRLLQDFFNVPANEEVIHTLIYQELSAKEEIKFNREKDLKLMLANTHAHLNAEIFHTEKKWYFKRQWLRYAAAAFLIISLGTWVYLKNTVKVSQKESGSIAIAESIPPGGNRAKLVLADGRTVQLSEEESGLVTGEHFSYDNGKPIALPDQAVAGSPSTAFTVSTPNGGTYQLLLEDGTKVWLNASTSLHCAGFEDDERVIHLTGEAYFEVKPGKRPFKVVTNDQTIAVLGTAFNLSAYEDGQSGTTTLVSGAVLLTSNRSQAVTQLSPGQQGVLTGGEFQVRKVDTRSYTAWKDGYFYFDKTPMKEAMAAISRWYDLEIQFSKARSQTFFYGEISRNKPLSEVLGLLEAAGLRFRMETGHAKNKLIIN